MSDEPQQLTDPHPTLDRFVGRQAAFDAVVGGVSKRLSGVVTAQRFTGYTERGRIPDYELTVRGASGKEMKISLVESYTTFRE